MNIQRFFLIWVGFFCMYAMGLQSAQAAWQTDKYIKTAREALSLGQIKPWKQALIQGEAIFAVEQPKMSLQERNNAGLWLNMLWAKYYQYTGILPLIRNISEFEDKKDLDRFIKQFSRSVTSLKKALHYQSQYNGLYTQVMDRSNVRSQVYLQASLSLSRDVQERIRSSQIYLAFLRYAHNHWSDKTKIKKQINRQHLAIQKLKQIQRRSKRSRQTIVTRQHKLASSIQSSRTLYKKLTGRIGNQYVISGLLIGLGIPLALAGGGVGAYGGYLLGNKETHKQEVINPSCHDGDVSCFRSKVEAYQQQMWTFLGIGGGALVVGVVMVVTGVLTLPAKKAQDEALLKSHNKHLDYERKKKKARSSRSFGKKNRSAVLALVPPRVGSVTLGRWR